MVYFKTYKTRPLHDTFQLICLIPVFALDQSNLFWNVNIDLILSYDNATLYNNTCDKKWQHDRVLIYVFIMYVLLIQRITYNVDA